MLDFCFLRLNLISTVRLHRLELVKRSAHISPFQESARAPAVSSGHAPMSCSEGPLTQGLTSPLTSDSDGSAGATQSETHQLPPQGFGQQVKPCASQLAFVHSSCMQLEMPPVGHSAWIGNWGQVLRCLVDRNLLLAHN